MKKLLTLILALAMLLALVGCSYLPEDLQAQINGVISGIMGGETPDGGDEIPDEPEHVHNFVETEKKKAYCGKDGWAKYECSSCGETKEEVIPKLGHDIQYYSTTNPTCLKTGAITHKCTRCSTTEVTNLPALGHDWGETTEPSRIVCCTREGCAKTQMPETNGKYAEVLAFTFGDSEKAELEAKHNELETLLNTVAKYDPELHGYAEAGELADAYEAAYALYEQYSDLIFSAQGQYSIAMTLYYCNHKNTELEKTYNDMQTYYTDLVAKFYSLSQPWYDSMFRDFFFYGATEEEINAFLFDSNAYANPEYTALKDRNDAIELEFNSLANPTVGTAILDLYSEFVENNNRIAEILGYDSYLEYAYENVYDREYSPDDVAAFVEYVKEYIAPMYNTLYSKWNSITSSLDQDTIDEYYSVVSDSFFVSPVANKLYNDYIDDMNMGFTSNPDKVHSFSEHLNNLMTDGNLFRGTYEGAYVTYIIDGGIPMAYFGSEYQSCTTVAHEFGHYMNNVYNGKEYDQSFDLLETHSQGNEMLFIYYIEDFVSAKGYELIETYQLLSTISTVMSAVQVDCFEQAIYRNSYDGPNSDVIMADGKITSDEYDLLYASISEDLGIAEAYRQDDYWRYGMTISSPCYYISYSVSAINALGLYADAKVKGFDAAKESYLKLFTYTDTYTEDTEEEMTLIEVLEYAGLTSYTEERTYMKIGSLVK